MIIIGIGVGCEGEMILVVWEGRVVCVVSDLGDEEVEDRVDEDILLMVCVW